MKLIKIAALAAIVGFSASAYANDHISVTIVNKLQQIPDCPFANACNEVQIVKGNSSVYVPAEKTTIDSTSYKSGDLVTIMAAPYFNNTLACTKNGGWTQLGSDQYISLKNGDTITIEMNTSSSPPIISYQVTPASGSPADPVNTNCVETVVSGQNNMSKSK